MNWKNWFRLSARAFCGACCHAGPQKTVKTSTELSNGPPRYVSCGAAGRGAARSSGRCSGTIRIGSPRAGKTNVGSCVWVDMVPAPYDYRDAVRGYRGNGRRANSSPGDLAPCPGGGLRWDAKTLLSVPAATAQEVCPEVGV